MNHFKFYIFISHSFQCMHDMTHSHSYPVFDIYLTFSSLLFVSIFITEETDTDWSPSCSPTYHCDCDCLVNFKPSEQLTSSTKDPPSLSVIIITLLHTLKKAATGMYCVTSQSNSTLSLVSCSNYITFVYVVVVPSILLTCA